MCGSPRSGHVFRVDMTRDTSLFSVSLTERMTPPSKCAARGIINKLFSIREVSSEHSAKEKSRCLTGQHFFESQQYLFSWSSESSSFTKFCRGEKVDLVSFRNLFAIPGAKTHIRISHINKPNGGMRLTPVSRHGRGREAFGPRLPRNTT